MSAKNHRKNDDEKKAGKHKNDDEQNGCTRTIDKKVAVVAEVSIKPHVHLIDSEIEVKCKSTKVCRSHKKNTKTKECKFFIEQELFLRIPIKFDAEVEAKPFGLICDTDNRCRQNEKGDLFS